MDFGARYDAATAAADFAVWSAAAERVELLLAGAGGAVARRVPMDRDGERFAVCVDDLAPGACYAFAVDDGPPLLDPYARALSGEADASQQPWSVVVDTTYDWGDDVPLRRPWSESLVYECHVKHLTWRHPDVPAAARGRYLGVCADPVLEHMTALGVTAVELMPVHHRLTERHLTTAKKKNVWGYSTIGFFAPDARFASSALGAQVAEFREMVRRLHDAGIEVILDVVYNHTGEGGRDGPTRCFRGLDDAAYYRRQGDAPEKYRDVTGCGNTLDTSQPPGLRMVVDSLRFWVEEMHVDGFRFDLAPALFREAEADGGAFAADGAFARAVAAEPSLRDTKLIAEPWDLGPDGYCIGRFAEPWREWNGKFRDGVRRVWRGDGGCRGELAARLAGSGDVFEARGGAASVHYVACHDGFTTADVVAYEKKHNAANGHRGRDGTDQNYSCNWGVEGPTDDAAIAAIRATVQKSLLLTVAVSVGVPMLLAGDELGRTQRGNNNPYCVDNPSVWLDWDVGDGGGDLLAFVREAFALRRDSRLLREGGRYGWWRPDAEPMLEDDWADGEARALAMVARCDDDPTAARLLLANPSDEAVVFTLPPGTGVGAWWHRLSSAPPTETETGVVVPAHGLSVYAWEPE